VALPKHLEPLLDGTPLAIERIKHAWPGLPTSDRAYLLAILLADTSKERKAIRWPLRWPHHQTQLVDLALADDNAYIRYLAAKNLSAPFKPNDDDETPSYLEEKARFEKVKADPVILVRSACEAPGSKVFMPELDDAESFWKRPQTERLAIVNGVKEKGEKIAELLRYATTNLLPIKATTLEEMLDVLLQYVGGQTISERVAESESFDDGLAEYFAGESVKALWEVVPDIPKALSYVLIECLPEEAGLQSNIPRQVIASLDEGQLQHLLWRNDITLKNLRRKLYKESTNELLRWAAVSSLDLLDSDISEQVYEPQEPAESGKKKVNELAMLAENCRGATLVQLQAICDLISDAPTGFHSGFNGKWDAIGFGKRFQTERAKRLSPSTLQHEIFAVRLFALAKQLAPIKSGETPKELPETLGQHQDIVVPHNPWQTYLNLTKVVRLDRWKQTVGYLPSVHIRDFDLPDEFSEESDDDHDRRQLFDLLEDVQGRVKDVSEQDRAELSALSRALSTLSSQMVDVETATGRRVEVLHSRIEKLVRTVNILLWLAGAILLFVLFVFFR
jgi:hypothetical protein